ncbi:MAG: DNA-binding protein [Clostridiales bacterium]|nr:DNA-binding protein [Clostridiales bacterium]
MIEKRARVAILFDLYGALLTEKQGAALRLFYEEDFSLSEIAQEFAISRQAVNDLLRRSEGLLEGYEGRLGLLRRRERRRLEREKLAGQARFLQQSPGAEEWALFWRQFENWEDE